jgi:hypothetical protein
LLREECLSEIKRHPAKLVRGWWRALRFVCVKNTPFRSVFPEMPSVWFTEFARWATLLGIAFSVFLLLKGTRVDQQLKRYQALSWLNLATLLGMITSLPFAPPWDGETRVFAATLPLFFLLPASGVGGLCQILTNNFYRFNLESNADPKQKTVIGLAAVIGGVLTLVIILGSWCLVGNSSVKDRPHPVRLMIDELASGPPSTSSVDLRSLRAGYHLRVSNDTRPTWLPDISRKDFVHNIPQLWGYLPLAPAFNRLPPGSEVVVLPYWILLVLDKQDAQEHRFTPQPEQMGHAFWPPVYFSKGLRVNQQ